MPNARHIGRAGFNDDKKFDFVSPDARSSDRSATHRYFPLESKSMARSAVPQDRADEQFTTEDFKARWWPAPDSAP